MKVCTDENISPRIVKAIDAIAKGDGFEITSVRDLGMDGCEDCYWIKRFAKMGGEAIVTADTDFLKKAPQIIAIEETGLIVIHMPRKWANATARLQLAHMLIWWPRIEDTLKKSNPRECWQPPWNIKETGSLKPIDLDFPAARKKLKKAQRPSRQIPSGRS